MNKILYTLGYGLLEGTHAERKRAFQDRLKGIQEEIGLPVVVVDIRKIGSSSRNGKWCDQSPHNGVGLWETLEEIEIPYSDQSVFANHYGHTQRGFAEYRRSITSRNDYLFQYEINSGYIAHLLLCAERKPFKPSGAPNCHRVVLAEELVKRMGMGWEVWHL